MFSIAEIAKTFITLAFIIIRAEHMCMHPVVSSNQWDGLQGGYTKFEIQIGD